MRHPDYLKKLAEIQVILDEARMVSALVSERRIIVRELFNAVSSLEAATRYRERRGI